MQDLTGEGTVPAGENKVHSVQAGRQATAGGPFLAVHDEREILLHATPACSGRLYTKRQTGGSKSAMWSGAADLLLGR